MAMSPIDIIHFLTQDGWTEVRNIGETKLFTHSTKMQPGEFLSIPLHHREIPPATLNAILIKAGFKI